MLFRPWEGKNLIVCKLRNHAFCFKKYDNSILFIAYILALRQNDSIDISWKSHRTQFQIPFFLLDKIWINNIVISWWLSPEKLLQEDS